MRGQRTEMQGQRAEMWGDGRGGEARFRVPPNVFSAICSYSQIVFSRFCSNTPFVWIFHRFGEEMRGQRTEMQGQRAEMWGDGRGGEARFRVPPNVFSAICSYSQFVFGPFCSNTQFVWVFRRFGAKMRGRRAEMRGQGAKMWGGRARRRGAFPLSSKCFQPVLRLFSNGFGPV